MACPGNEIRNSSTTQTENNASAEEEVLLKKSASNTLAVMYQKNGAGTCNYRSLTNMMICFHRQTIRAEDFSQQYKLCVHEFDPWLL